MPCKIAPNGNAGELSLAENVVRIAMHPADQVVAFAALAGAGVTVAAIAARFGVSERTVEQRLRLGNAAPELLDAYRAEEIDLETLMAFAVTTDHDRQRSVWERVSAQGYRRSAWQVKRMLTEERVPAGAAMARFVGVDTYEAAGGSVLRDLFADEYENGVWLEDPKLLGELAMTKLTAAADELATRWKWADAMPEVDWSATARFGRIQPEPGEPTAAENAEIEKLRTRHDELATMDEDEWTDELVEEAEAIEPRLDAIEAEVDARARFRPEDFAMAGCIATIGRDGTLQVIQGLVKPEDMPKESGATANGQDADAGNDATTDSGRVDGPAISTPLASPVDPRTKAREEAGVGIGLADDLRAIRTALIKAHLAGDFEAAFDLVVFQMVRAVFARGYTGSWHALDIVFNETADRPTTRTNDDDFAAWSPGEAMLADWSHLPFEWMGGDDDAACFAALKALPRADKETLFAAAVARTVKGQLAFEHGARPELEATVARLGIDFAKHVRPTAAMLWSRIKKSRILDVARETLGAAWALTRSKYKKADLAKSMEEAFAAGAPPISVGATAHAAALAWTMPGFAAFDTGGADADGTAKDPAPVDNPGEGADASGDAKADPAGKPTTTSVVESIDSPTVAEQRATAIAAEARNGKGESTATAEPDAGKAPEGPGRPRRGQRPGRPGLRGGRGRSGAGERSRRGRGQSRRSGGRRRHRRDERGADRRWRTPRHRAAGRSGQRTGCRRGPAGDPRVPAPRPLTVRHGPSAPSRRRFAQRSSQTSPRSPSPAAPATGIASSSARGTPCVAGAGFAAHRLAHSPPQCSLHSCARSCGARPHFAPHCCPLPVPTAPPTPPAACCARLPAAPAAPSATQSPWRLPSAGFAGVDSPNVDAAGLAVPDRPGRPWVSHPTHR